MICCCSLAGTAACNSCWNNPNTSPHSSNFVTWTDFSHQPEQMSYEDTFILLDEMGISKQTCHNESENGFLCSACSFGDFDSFKFKPNYCPNCGARVIGAGE